MGPHGVQRDACRASQGMRHAAEGRQPSTTPMKSWSPVTEYNEHLLSLGHPASIHSPV